VTCPSDLLEIEGLSTQGSRRGRTFDESVGRDFIMDSTDLSNGNRYHKFDTTSDTDINLSIFEVVSWYEGICVSGSELQGAGRAG